jgi:hypothetical protein
MKKILWLTIVFVFPSFLCFASQEEYESLRYYAYTRDTASLKQLVDKGYDIDAVDGEGDSALCAAVYDKDTEAFNLLASFGADLNHDCVRQMSDEIKRDFNSSLDKKMSSYSDKKYRLPVKSERGALAKKASTGQSFVKSGMGLRLSPTALAVAGTVMAGTVAVAVGSSGGGSGKNSISVYTSPSLFETAEYKSGNFLSQINASSAYARGYFGTNSITNEKVRVGLVADSIPESDHQELAGQIIQTFDMTNGETTYTDSSGNTLTMGDLYLGSYESGIIAALRDDLGMHGVAPDAGLLVSYIGYAKKFNLGKVTAPLMDNGARVINIAFNNSLLNDESVYADKINEVYPTDSSSYFELLIRDASGMGAASALRRASEENIVIVFPAGDGSYSSPQLIAGAPLVEEFSSSGAYSLENLFITVVAVDSENEISDFSNRCGVAKEYCLAAPGENINAPLKNYSIFYKEEEKEEKIVSGISVYTTKSGTPAAASVVTGSVALLMGAFPHLSSQEVVALLFETATDLGDSGVDEIYGHGLINLDKATAPVGDLSVVGGSSVHSSKTVLSGTSLQLPSFLSNSAIKNLPEEMAVLDKYSRAYMVPTSSFIKQAEKSDKAFLNNLRMLGARNQTETVRFSDTFSFSFSNSGNASSAKLRQLSEKKNNNTSLKGLGFLSFSYDLTKTSSVGVYFNDDTKYGQGSWFDKPLENPFLEKRRAYGLKNDFALTDTVHFENLLETGVVYFDDLPEDETLSSVPKVYSAQSKLTWQPVKDFSLSVSGGFMKEEDSLFKMMGKGAFKTTTSSTYFMGAQTSFLPTEKLKLSASLFYGVSKMPKTGTSLVRFSNLTSSSFAIDARYKLTQEDFAGMTLSSPLGINKGYAMFNLPVGRHPTEDIVYRSSSKVSLEVEKTEYDFSFYHARQGELFDIKTAATVRFNPDQQSGVRPDYRLMLYLSSAF